MSRAPALSFSLSAPVYGGVPVSAGQLLIPDGTGFYVPATAANRTTYAHRTEAVALTPYSASSQPGGVSIQEAGTMDASVSLLGTGAASWVRCSATGFAERFTPVGAGTSDVIGWCETDGRLHLQFGTLTESLILGVVIGGVTALEAFGAKGDGVTDDTAAFNLAAAAAKLGAFKVLQLGAKTYLINSSTVSWPFGVDIIGTGTQSVLTTTTLNEPILKVYDSTPANRAKSTSFRNFTLLGSIGTTPGNTLQNGLSLGYFGGDGSSRVTVDGVIAKNMSGVGFVAAYGDDFAFGPLLTNCTADGCYQGLDGYGPGEAVGFRAVSCTNTGVFVGNNFCMTGGFIELCTLGMYIRQGSNDGHSVITGVSFLHNTTALQVQTGLANGEFFTGCRFYQGDIQIPNGLTRAITFGNCTFDLTSWTLQGKVRFLNCSFNDGYANTLTTAVGGELEFVNPRALNMSIPSWIGGLIYQSYTFPSDADQTLSALASWSQTLDIQAGVVSASRTLTMGTRPPNKGQLLKVKNRTALAIGIKWATGAGVNVASNATATIGADGTNAVDWSDGLATTVDPAILALSGFWQGSFTTTPWVGSASAGLSSGHNITGGGGAGSGTAVNGYNPATFNGTSNSLDDLVNGVGTYITTTDYTVSGVIYFNSAAAPAALIYNNPSIVGMNGSAWGVVYDTGGIKVFHAATLVGTLPCPTGVWKSFDIKFTGGTLQMRLGNAAWTTFSTVAATGSLAGGTLRVGANYANAVFLNASIMVLETSLVALTDAQLNGQYAFRQARYPAMGL